MGAFGRAGFVRTYLTRLSSWFLYSPTFFWGGLGFDISASMLSSSNETKPRLVAKELLD